jgi:hypothetical protein
MISVTVGLTGRQYPSLQEAWNALPATLADNYEFLCYNDGEMGVLDTAASAKTTGSFTVTIKPATGQGYRDNPNKLTAPLRYAQPNGVSFSAGVFLGQTFNITANNVILEGIAVRNTNDGPAILIDGTGCKIRRCIADSATSSVHAIVMHQAVECIGNLIIVKNATGGGISTTVSSTLRNNTIVYIGSGTSTGTGVAIAYQQTTATGNNVFGFNTAFSTYSTTFHTSSDYNATDRATIGTGQGANNLTSLTFASQFVAVGTAGSEDLRVKSGSALINACIYSADIDPDILGQTRHASTPTIGAFEYVAGSVVNLTGANSTQTASSGTGVVEVTSIPTVNLVGSDSTQSASSGTGAISTAVGTLISSPMKSFFTGLLRANETGITVFVYDQYGDTGDKVVKLTGQSSNASGIWSGTNALFVIGRDYLLRYKLADSSWGAEVVTAT